MLIELGHFAMILALALTAAQAFFGLAGAQLNRDRWLAVVPAAVTGQFLFLAFGTFTLVHAFVVNDFSVKYVAAHSNSALPLFYRIAALWGAHEGSLLLWICVLGLWTIAVALCKPADHAVGKAYFISLVPTDRVRYAAHYAEAFSCHELLWVEGGATGKAGLPPSLRKRD